MTLYEQKMQIARKKHECEFCGKKIAPKESYSYESGKYDGDFFTRKLCIPCYGMLQAYAIDTEWNEFRWDDVQEWLHEKHCHDCAEYACCKAKPQECEKLRLRYNKTIKDATGLDGGR